MPLLCVLSLFVLCVAWKRRSGEGVCVVCGEERGGLCTTALLTTMAPPPTPNPPPLLPPSVPFNPGTVTDALYTEAAAVATARLGFEVTGMDLMLAGLSYRAVPGMSDDDLRAKILAARSKGAEWRAEGGAWRVGVLCVRYTGKAGGTGDVTLVTHCAT